MKIYKGLNCSLCGKKINEGEMVFAKGKLRGYWKATFKSAGGDIWPLLNEPKTYCTSCIKKQ